MQVRSCTLPCGELIQKLAQLESKLDSKLTIIQSHMDKQSVSMARMRDQVGSA